MSLGGRLLLAGILAACAWRPAAAQSVFPAANGEALAGVTAVDAQVLVLNWLEVKGDQEAFRARAQPAFAQAIRGLGLSVADDAPNFLFCELKVAEAPDGSIVYAWAIGYYEFVVAGAHRLQWTTGGIVRVAGGRFTGRTAVEECTDGFRREWSKANPRP